MFERMHACVIHVVLVSSFNLCLSIFACSMHTHKYITLEELFVVPKGSASHMFLCYFAVCQGALHPLDVYLLVDCDSNGDMQTEFWDAASYITSSLYPQVRDM